MYFKNKFINYSIAASFCIFIFSQNIIAQQNAQWPFYLAFEDASNTKDTIWLVYDSLASADYTVLEPNLGEIPLDNSNGQFRVWMYLDEEGNQYNTFALNTDESFHEASIYAENFVLPITIKWDSTLFTSDVLYDYGFSEPIYEAIFDNQYFFIVNNGGPHHTFNLTYDNHVIMEEFDWGDGDPFPLFVSFLRGPLGSGVGLNEKNSLDFTIYPNPAATYSQLLFTKVIDAQIRIYDINGKLVKSDRFKSDSKRIDLDLFEAGLYFVEVENKEGRIVKKIVVNK